MKKTEIVLFVLILLAFAVGICLYPQMPEQMASHWNAQGQVDGFMSKFWGVFLMPFVLVILALIFIAIPRIDPLKKNIAQFEKYYNEFIIIFFLFLLSIYFQTLLWNLGIKINPGIIIPIGLGILFFYVGILLEKAKRNWFIGIRTPWTLSSDRVWDKTHQIGGKLFKLSAIIVFIALFFPRYTTYFILGPILAATLFSVGYSYYAYQKEKKA